VSAFLKYQLYSTLFPGKKRALNRCFAQTGILKYEYNGYYPEYGIRNRSDYYAELALLSS
jgi:hypothetical protein